MWRYIAESAFRIADTLRIGRIELDGLSLPACSSPLDSDSRLLYFPQASQCKAVMDSSSSTFFQNSITPNCPCTKGHKQVFSLTSSNIGAVGTLPIFA